MSIARNGVRGEADLIIDNEMDCPGKYGARGSGKEISMPCVRAVLSVTVVPMYAIGTSEGGMRATMRLRCVEKRSRRSGILGRVDKHAFMLVGGGVWGTVQEAREGPAAVCFKSKKRKLGVLLCILDLASVLSSAHVGVRATGKGTSMSVKKFEHLWLGWMRRRSTLMVNTWELM